MAVLETSMSSKTRENGKKSGKNDKKNVKKVLLVAQEIKLARVLAGNNKTARDRAVKSLRKWFQNRATAIPFTEDDFLRLWKGLFYSMWMSDKPLIQEECAENIANLMHALPFDSALLFYKCGMRILMNEWFGIDQHRLDKFSMFVRRLLRQCLFVLKNENWTKISIKKFTETLSQTILDPETQKPMGLLMHFIEIYLEELAKVSDGDLAAHLLTEFLVPFIKELSFSEDPRIIDHIRKHVFIYLIRQSDLGLDYEEKYKAWSKLGFPGSIDSMKKVEISDSENEEIEDGEEKEKVFDPRAGRVNVDLPQLKFHPKAIAKALNECKFSKFTNMKSRKCLTELTEHFKKMASGIYPLGIKKVKLAEDGYDMSIRKAVNRLVKFDQKIKGNRNKKKRKLEKDDEIELRGGKRIKLSEKLSEKIANELCRVSEGSEKRKKKKRKLPEMMDSPSKKKRENEPMMELESIFKRNSGTWFVTKSVRVEESEDENSLIETKQENENGGLFSESQWEEDDNFEYKELFMKRKKETREESNGEGRSVVKRKFEQEEEEAEDGDEDGVSNVMQQEFNNSVKNSSLLKNPFATPNSSSIKKVKINIKLNRSQEIDEHQAQIKSSPAIPYDANKKPSKPLLKPTVTKSPINPFYNKL